MQPSERQSIIVDDGPYERNRALRNTPEYAQMVKESVKTWRRRRRGVTPLCEVDAGNARWFSLIDDRVQLTDETRGTPEFRAMRERVKLARERRRCQTAAAK